MSLSESHQVNDKKGIDKKFVVRHDLTNKKLWVFEVYYADLISGVKTFRSYPQFISAGYLTKESCIKGIEDYDNKGSTGVSWTDEARAKA